MKTPVLLTFETKAFHASPMNRRARARLSKAGKTRAQNPTAKMAAAASRRNSHLLSVKAKAKVATRRLEEVRKARARMARATLVDSLNKEAESTLRRYMGIRDTLIRLGAHHANVAITHNAKIDYDIAAIENLNDKLQEKLVLSSTRRNGLLERRAARASAEVAKARQIGAEMAEKEAISRAMKACALTIRMESAATRRSERLMSLSPKAKKSPSSSPMATF